MRGERAHFYEFRAFRLEPGERRLLKDGHEIAITPKALDVLLFLVERADHLVEKDELMAGVWPDAFVEEANLSRVVHTLRKILGDDGQENKYIETVAKKGYRFSVPAAKISARLSEVLAAPSNPASEDDVAQRSIPGDGDRSLPAPLVEKRPRYVLIATATVLALMFTALLAFDRPSSPLKPASIAVLPLRSLNGNQEEVFKLAIAESLITQLKNGKGMTIRPLSSTWKYLDTDVDVVAAGREQNVDFVLASTYQIVEGKIRVTAQLINVNTGSVEDTFKSERDLAGIFATQDAVAADVGGLILKRFGTLAGDPASARGTTNEEAYRLYLEGSYLVDRRKPAETKKALESFEKALALDPGFAKAWAGKAYAYRTGSWQGESEDRSFTLAKYAVETAMRLDPNTADAYVMLCEMKDTYEWKFAEADAACRRAVELDPRSAHARRFYALYLNDHGRFEEALEQIKISLEIEPASVFGQRILGQVYFNSRNYDAAIVQLKRVLFMDPTFRPGSGMIWQSYWLKGDEENAFKEYKAFISRFNRPPEELADFEQRFAASRFRGVLEGMAARFVTAGEVAPYQRSPAIYAQLGEIDLAIQTLYATVAGRRNRSVTFAVNPMLDPIRSDPRYAAILAKVGLQ